MSHSRAPFQFARVRIPPLHRENRCAICLQLVPKVSTYLIDSAAEARSSQLQLDAAVSIGVLPSDYQRSSSTNSIAILTGGTECPNCRIAHFTTNLIALSPPLPVLLYIHNYLANTPRLDRKPLHKVFSLFRDAVRGEDVSESLPDPTPILPFLWLSTIVILKPESVLRRCIVTDSLPALSILQNNQFTFASNGTLPGDANVARVFDVLELNPVPNSYGRIPLSLEDPGFREQRYWRLTLSMEAILAALMAQVGTGVFESQEIRVVQAIYRDLMIDFPPVTATISKPNGGPCSGGPPGDDRGRGGTPRKRKRSTNSEPSRKTLTRMGQKIGEDDLSKKSLADASSFTTNISNLNESVRSKGPFEDPKSMLAAGSEGDW